MPVRRVGEDCYQWGNQKLYCGKDAKRKAILQGIAIENTGWLEAEDEPATGDETFEIIFVAYNKKFGDREHLIFGKPIDESEIIEEIDIFVDKMVTVFTLEQLEGGFDKVTEVQNEYPNDGRITILTALFGMAIDRKVWWIDLREEWQAEEVKWSDFPNMGLVIPSTLRKEGPLYLHEGHLLIGMEDKHNRWKVWDLDRQVFLTTNYFLFPLWRDKYEGLTSRKAYREWTDDPDDDSEEPLFFDYDELESLDDAIILAEWDEGNSLKTAKDFWTEDDVYGLSLVKPFIVASLRHKMNKRERDYARHPNRSVVIGFPKDYGGNSKKT